MRFSAFISTRVDKMIPGSHLAVITCDTHNAHAAGLSVLAYEKRQIFIILKKECITIQYPKPVWGLSLG